MASSHSSASGAFDWSAILMSTSSVCGGAILRTGVLRRHVRWMWERVGRCSRSETGGGKVVIRPAHTHRIEMFDEISCSCFVVCRGRSGACWACSAVCLCPLQPLERPASCIFMIGDV